MDESITLPGLVVMVPVARHYVRALLGDTPCTDDAQTVVSELATNALRHSGSALPGATFTIHVLTKPGWTRVEVIDAGPAGWTASDTREADESGRGLILVHALADRMGHELDDAETRVWAEFDWHEPDTAYDDLPTSDTEAG